MRDNGHPRKDAGERRRGDNDGDDTRDPVDDEIDSVMMKSPGFLPKDSSSAAPFPSRPGADDVPNDDEQDNDTEYIINGGAYGSHHVKMESFRLHSKQEGQSQIIPGGSGHDGRGQLRRGRRRGAAEAPPSSTLSAPRILKRISVEYPLELTRVEVQDAAASMWSSPSYHVSTSRRRMLDVVTGVPVSQTVSASMHCQAGLKGTRTGFSTADLEVRYKPIAIRNPAQSDGGTRGAAGVGPSTRQSPRRLDATYTAGVSLTERPSLSAGATVVATHPQNEGRVTTFSWKIASPTLNLVDVSSSSPSPWRWWWSGLAGRVGWSRDVASFCTVRSSLAATLSKHRAVSTPRSTVPAGSVSWSSASLAVASRNTVHKWSAALSWSPLNVSKSSVGSQRSARTAQVSAKLEPEASRASSMSWWPRIALSASPQLHTKRWERTCRVSGWYSLSDASWSVSASTARAGNNSQLSVGWTTASSGAWTYLMTVPLGSVVTIRIPVTVTAVLDPFWYPVQVGLVSLVSGLIQEAVSHVMVARSGSPSRPNGSTSVDNNAVPSLRRQRARQLAENQQTLMRRTAENRMRAERAKNRDDDDQQPQGGGGLVIDRAVYYTDRESWDVTIPLQFWVQDSVLDIGPPTKKDLLGFYDLSYRAEPSRSSKDDDPAAPSWISGFWRPRRDAIGNGYSGESGAGGRRRVSSFATQELVTPKLTIEYTYNGKPHEETFRDHDEIILPRREVN